MLPDDAKGLPVNDDRASSSSATSGWRGIAFLLILLALAAAAVFGWRAWKSRDSEEQARQQTEAQRLAALEQRLDAVRRDQRTLTQRLQDATATNRVLRDEVLGLGQRGALLEESVARLSDPSRHGAQALRLDEVELLLTLAGQRLQVADDLQGARRAYALAAGALEGIDDHRLLNLKQVLAQERAALDALGEGPRARAERALDAFAAGLDALPARTDAAHTERSLPAWQRWLSPLVQVRPTRTAAIVTPSDRHAAEAALHVEISLAHAALERDDRAGFHATLTRIDQWMVRLWPDSAALRRARQQVGALRQLPLRSESPLLGSTLEQLRALRNSGLRLPVTPPSIAATPRQETTP